MKIQTLGVIAAAALLVGGITNLDAKGTEKTHVSKKEPVKGKLNHDEAIKKINQILILNLKGSLMMKLLQWDKN